MAEEKIRVPDQLTWVSEEVPRGHPSPTGFPEGTLTIMAE